ncbi:MAG TPA: Clp protease N-terminal domain-containing protein, partial [Rheinheimera sp.]|nr:Clp protease N-terminal domain-containing protein [Rheinheimera sp.]
MLNKDLELTLNLAFRFARERRHEYMTVEHLLLALLDNPAAGDALRSCGANIEKLRQELSSFIDSTTPVLPDGELERDTQPTLGFQRVLQRAVFHVQSSGKSEVTGANVLVAIFSEQESQAVYLLKKIDISRLDVVNFISHGVTKTEKLEQHDEHAQDEGSETLSDESKFLENFTANLNLLAKNGQIDPLIGREHEVERAIQVLCRRKKNNPLLV